MCVAVAGQACIIVNKPAPDAPPAPAPTKPARATVAQPSATGRPASLDGNEGGFWIWRDGKGWHLRTTTAGGKHQFAGKVVGRGSQLKDVQSAKVESGDKIRFDSGKVEFDFTTQGAHDGFDFNLDGNACATFNLELDGKDAPHKIMVGQAEQHPQASRFTACP